MTGWFVVKRRSAGGKAWDTVKPLACYFSKLDRVLLVDDDAYKVRGLRLESSEHFFSLTFALMHTMSCNYPKQGRVSSLLATFSVHPLPLSLSFRFHLSSKFVSAYKHALAEVVCMAQSLLVPTSTLLQGVCTV